jgi:hypothetical protein
MLKFNVIDMKKIIFITATNAMTAIITGIAAVRLKYTSASLTETPDEKPFDDVL